MNREEDIEIKPGARVSILKNGLYFYTAVIKKYISYDKITFVQGNTSNIRPSVTIGISSGGNEDLECDSSETSYYLTRILVDKLEEH